MLKRTSHVIVALMLLTGLLLAACASRAAPLSTQAPAAPTAVPDQAGIGDRYYPLEGNRGYDAQHYTIELTAAPYPTRSPGGRPSTPWRPARCRASTSTSWG